MAGNGLLFEKMQQCMLYGIFLIFIVFYSGTILCDIRFYPRVHACYVLGFPQVGNQWSKGKLSSNLLFEAHFQPVKTCLCSILWLSKTAAYRIIFTHRKISALYCNLIRDKIRHIFRSIFFNPGYLLGCLTLHPEPAMRPCFNPLAKTDALL